MDFCFLIEKLAYSIDSNSIIVDLLDKQSPAVQKAFFFKNSLLLREQLCDISQMPDKNTVFGIKK